MLLNQWQDYKQTDKIANNLFMYLSIYLSTYLPTCSACLTTYLYNIPTYLSLSSYLSIYLSFSYLRLALSLSLSACVLVVIVTATVVICSHSGCTIILIYYKLADNDSLSYLAAKFITKHVDKLYDLTQD